jgi:hypothetical protein
MHEEMLQPPRYAEIRPCGGHHIRRCAIIITEYQWRFEYSKPPFVLTDFARNGGEKGV